MKRIEKLSAAQASRLPEFRDEWLRVGLSTERADRPRAEAGVRVAYEAASLPPPSLVIWLDSPMAGALCAALLADTAKAGKGVRAQVRDQVRAQVRAQVGAQIWAQVWAQVRAQVWAQVEAQVWDQVGDQVGAQVEDQVWDQVGAQVWAQVRAQVRAQVWRAAYGQHDANWLGWLAFFGDVLSLQCVKRAHGLSEIARSCGWWWPLDGAVILTERPIALHRNAEGRLHNEGGPALLYPDGWGIWAINGARVPTQVIEAPETLTPEQVKSEPNTEVRRHMLDRYGGLRGSLAAGKWISDMGLKAISELDITDKMQPSGLSIWRLSNKDAPVLCKLYRAEMEDDEELALLWVVCTSTAKETFLRVPPAMRTAEEARAWTFGVEPKALAEALET
jgi:hypothetical protein